MEIDISKIPMNKVYQKHSKGVIWTGILSLVVLGIMVAFFFLPIFAYFPSGGTRVDMNVVSFIGFTFRDFIKGLYSPQFDRFVASVESYNGMNPLFTWLAQSYSIFQVVILGFLLISVIFALIVGIKGLIFLLRGHAKNTIMMSALSHSVTSFMAMFLSLLFLYLLLCRKMFVECNIMDHLRFFITPFLLILASLAVAIVLSVIYKKCFKKKVYILDYKLKPTDNPEFKNSPVHKYMKNFPNGTTTIGDKAFDMNEEIKNAFIPEGILLLGQNAFSNCLNLEKVTLPESLQEIGTNCFFNTPNLKGFIYKGTMEQWKAVYKGTDWIGNSAAEVVEASDGKLILK